MRATFRLLRTECLRQRSFCESVPESSVRAGGVLLRPDRQRFVSDLHMCVQKPGRIVGGARFPQAITCGLWLAGVVTRTR